MVKALKDLATGFWKNDVGTRLTNLTLETAKLLMGGFEQPLIQYEKPDYAAISFIRANVFAFSHAKSLVQLKELSNLVVDKDKIRTFEEYMDQVDKLNQTYNVNYLETEYNTVVSSGQMARRWQEVQKQAGVFKMLVWDAVNDERTRDDHKKLDGVKLPANDRFWTKYWPPIDHNCRCDIRQERGGRGTPRMQAIERAKQAVGKKSPFFGNPSVDGMAYKRNHGYFNKKKFNRLDAVKDYGLRDPNKIYSKGTLSPLKPGLKDRSEWDQLFDKWQKDYKGSDGSFSVTDVLKRPVVFDQEAKKHVKRFNLAPSILDVLAQPDEIFSDDHSGKQRTKAFAYRYIKYYNETPVVVVVEPDNDQLRFVTIYDVEKNNLTDRRRGVLHYVDRI